MPVPPPLNFKRKLNNITDRDSTEQLLCYKDQNINGNKSFRDTLMVIFIKALSNNSYSPIVLVNL